MIKVLRRVAALFAGMLLPVAIYGIILPFLPKDLDGGVPFDAFLISGIWLSAAGGGICGLLQPWAKHQLMANVLVSPGTVIMLLVGVIDIQIALSMAGTAWVSTGIALLVRSWHKNEREEANTIKPDR